MKKIIFSIVLLSLVGCNKEEVTKAEPKSNCDCHEEYQALEPVYNGNGGVTTQWVNKGSTNYGEQDCSSAYDWKYTNGGETERKRMVCE